MTLAGATLAGSDAGNYLLTMTTTTADITAKEITGSFAAENKTYDGNTSATVTTGSRALTGTISGDDVSLTGGTATFANKNVGAAKIVTLAGSTLTGADASNYSLASVGNGHRRHHGQADHGQLHGPEQDLRRQYQRHRHVPFA